MKKQEGIDFSDKAGSSIGNGSGGVRGGHDDLYSVLLGERFYLFQEINGIGFAVVDNEAQLGNFRKNLANHAQDLGNGRCVYGAGDVVFGLIDEVGDELGFDGIRHGRKDEGDIVFRCRKNAGLRRGRGYGDDGVRVELYEAGSDLIGNGDVPIGIGEGNLQVLAFDVAGLT